MSKRAFLLLLPGLLLLTSPVRAQVWSAAGSTGVADPTAAGLYSFTGPSVEYLGTTTSTAPIKLRFPVISGSNAPAWTTFEVGYRDFGAGTAEQVTASLYRYDPPTGNVVPIALIFSTDNASSSSTAIPGAYLPIDFTRYLYYVDVTLTRNAGGGFNPALRYVRVR